MKKTTLLHIPADHPAFAGHFPGMPIVPGVVLLDAALHALAADIGNEGGWQIAAVKFLHPLGPDTDIRIEHEVQPGGAIRFEIREGERCIVTGTLSPRSTP